MITELNRLIELVETRLSDDLDIASMARSLGTTEYHIRRMFSSLTGVSLSEYVRRRRMTVAAADVLAGESLLNVAIRFGYGSTETFGRAFRAVHGATPAEVRNDGGPLRSQPQLRLRLNVEGDTPMDTRVVQRPAFRLVGYAARVPLIYEGPNPRVQAHISSLSMGEHVRLKSLGDAEPAGLLQVSADVDPDYAEGTDLTYLHGVAVDATTTVPDELDVIEVSNGTWAVFRTSGPYPAALQRTYGATASEWFPSNPWLLRPGPSIVAVLDHSEDFSTATTELWIPIDRPYVSGS